MTASVHDFPDGGDCACGARPTPDVTDGPIQVTGCWEDTRPDLWEMLSDVYHPNRVPAPGHESGWASNWCHACHAIYVDEVTAHGVG